MRARAALTSMGGVEGRGPSDVGQAPVSCPPDEGLETKPARCPPPAGSKKLKPREGQWSPKGEERLGGPKGWGWEDHRGAWGSPCLKGVNRKSGR